MSVILTLLQHLFHKLHTVTATVTATNGILAVSLLSEMITFDYDSRNLLLETRRRGKMMKMRFAKGGRKNWKYSARQQRDEGEKWKNVLVGGIF